MRCEIIQQRIEIGAGDAAVGGQGCGDLIRAQMQAEAFLGLDEHREHGAVGDQCR